MRGRLVPCTWTHDPIVYAPAKYRRACRYEAFVPEGLGGIEIALSGDLAGIVSDAELAVRSLNGRARPALAPFARLLLRTESIASSKVEGLQVDARALARAEARPGTLRTVGSKVREVLANIDAMEKAIEQTGTTTRIDPQGLVAIHETLMRPTKPHLAGRVRSVQNWIGGNDYNPCGADFVPPPPEEVRGLLEDLADFCNNEDLPPLVQAAIAHAQFETIHPFDDGNGRTGRALVHVMLRRRGLAPEYVPPISVALAANRGTYIAGLEAFRAGALGEWLEVFAVAAARSAQLAEEYLRRVSELQESWRLAVRRFLHFRSDAALWAVIDELVGYPVITVPVAVAATRRSKSAVNVAFDQLEAAGVLRPITAGGRNRAWEADGLLDLLADLEAGEVG